MEIILCVRMRWQRDRQIDRQTEGRKEKRADSLMDRQNDMDTQAGIQADGHRQLILKTEYCFYRILQVNLYVRRPT